MKGIGARVKIVNSAVGGGSAYAAWTERGHVHFTCPME
jgi:hypothetical protein